MAKTTEIAWCDSTWSPWRGCTKVSPACENCYAERRAKRWGEDFSEIIRSKSTFNDPLKWKEPKRIFVCSLSDFFHPDVPGHMLLDALLVMQSAPQHTYMILTKRPGLIASRFRDAGMSIPTGMPPNVWLGTTVESHSQEQRIVDLLKIPAAVHFVSVEPMLGSLDLRSHLTDRGGVPGTMGAWAKKKLDWVIAGGESGPHARPINPEWVRSLRDQCAEANVPYFFKQWGEWCHPDQCDAGDDFMDFVNSVGKPDGTVVDMSPVRYGIKNTGRLLDGKEYLEFPLFDKPKQICYHINAARPRRSARIKFASL